jgi:hypothetical protein
MKSTQLTAIVVLLAALAPVASADTITLTGTDATRGGFSVDLSYEGPNDRLEVVELVRWASGTEERRRGTGTRTGDRLDARLTDERGVADVIDPTARLSDVTLFVTFFDEGELEARATDASASASPAARRRSSPGATSRTSRASTSWRSAGRSSRSARPRGSASTPTSRSGATCTSAWAATSAGSAPRS